MLVVDELIKKKEYDFIRENNNLKNIMFLTLGGSHAYGTNIETSDVDIRGVALNSASDLIGFSTFEQVVDTPTDTTIYSFNKFVSLIINCNPNTIELLGNKDYYLLSKEGKLLLDNKHLFLSQRAFSAFSGYATQQLRRLENALARDSYPQPDKERHIKALCEASMLTFDESYAQFDGDNSIKLSIDTSAKEGLEAELYVDVALNHYPLRDIKNILTDMNNTIRNFDKLNQRNRKKDDAHLNKHAMHLIRLYLMCLDILEKCEINTYRGDDLELLLNIRMGRYQNADGSYKKEFFELVGEFEKKVLYAKKNTSLPKVPNMKKIEELVMTVNKGVITSG